MRFRVKLTIMLYCKISDHIDRYPELELLCREEIFNKYIDMMGADPLPEIIDYIMTIGVKNNSTRPVVFENFHVLLKDKTEELVKWLFDSLAPLIRKETLKKDRESNNQKIPVKTN